MTNYFDFNSGTAPSPAELADTIEPDPIMVGEYDWDSAPESLKRYFRHLTRTSDEPRTIDSVI